MKGTLRDGIGRVFSVERLGPGVYVDAAGALHLVTSEVLAALGVEDTPENRRECSRAMEAVLRDFAQGDVRVDRIDTEGTHVQRFEH